MDYLNSASKSIEKEIEGLFSLKKNLDENFNNVFNDLYFSEGKIIVSGIGKSGYISQKISSTLVSIGIESIYLHPSEAAHGDLGNVKKKDIVIIISKGGESIELFPLIEYCKKLNIKVISITENENSTLGKNSNHILKLPKINESCPIDTTPTTSTTMTLSLGNAISNALIEKNNFSKNEFKTYHPGGSLGNKLLKVSDVMYREKNIPLVLEDESMKRTIFEMSSKRFGCVGVIDEHKNLTGIITDGDLRRNFNKDIIDKHAKDFMTSNPLKINYQDFLEDTLKYMNEKEITVLFVIDDFGWLVGIIHLHDILRKLEGGNGK